MRTSFSTFGRLISVRLDERHLLVDVGLDGQRRPSAASAATRVSTNTRADASYRSGMRETTTMPTSATIQAAGEPDPAPVPHVAQGALDECSMVSFMRGVRCGWSASRAVSRGVRTSSAG